MDKLKKSLKHLFAPAIVLLLVAVMGVFSPVVSVAAALRLNAAGDPTPGLGSQTGISIENLPAKTVKVGSDITAPSVTGATAQLWHAGHELTLPNKYYEVGQYEWRFLIGETLIDTYVVTATESKYKMALPSSTVTVAPKGLSALTLPLPETYTLDGNTMKVVSVTADNENHRVKVVLKDSKKKNDNGTTYYLSVNASLENVTFDSNKISFTNENVSVNMAGHENATGNLKIAYTLKDADSKLLAKTTQTVEIKNLTKDAVTFAAAPTAPSVSGLKYYSETSLTAPSVKATANGTEFDVEGQTTIAKVRYSLNSKEPSDWNSAETINVTDGKFDNEIIKIDGLKVTVKKLGYFSFQFKTTTLFGYKFADSFTDKDRVEQDSDNTYVAYWSDSIKISGDSEKPQAAWVTNYTDSDISNLNESFEDLTDWDLALPMTSKPTDSTNKKVTVKFEQGVTLPALFPHDNATQYNDIDIHSIVIQQVQDANGNNVSDNTVSKSTSNGQQTFTYDPKKALQIKFNANEGDDYPTTQSENIATLKRSAGLYSVTIYIYDKKTKYEGDNVDGSSYQYQHYDYYFYVNDAATVSPSIDKNFAVNDVYLAEGDTFTFTAPTIEDDNTPTNRIKVDYYLVKKDTTTNTFIAKLDDTTVDLSKYELADNKAGNYYIYALARNFNGMQATLKDACSITENETTIISSDSVTLKNTLETADAAIAQYGYAWRRAEFTVYATSTNSANVANPTVTPEVTDTWKAGKKVNISNIKATWDSAAYGQISAAVYLVKDNNARVQMDLMNSEDEIVSSATMNKTEFTLEELYFTPQSSGKYLLVVTAKEFASDKIFTNVTEIQIESSGDYHARLATSMQTSMNYGDEITLPSVNIYDDKNVLTYITNGKGEILKASDNSVVANADYNISIVNNNDGKAITGNKFKPNKTGKYTIKYTVSIPGASAIAPIKCNIQVSEASNVTTILMDEAYGKNATSVGTKDAADNTKETPKYAIMLNDFVESNVNEANSSEINFTVDSAVLFDNLEAIKSGEEITGYMYPAIAIPNANIDGVNANEYEITVQKADNTSEYYVRTSKNKGTQIDGYYVFRPEGTFRKDVKTYNKDTYLSAAIGTINKSNVTGLYYVTYTANGATKTFNVTIGNQQKGEISWKENFLTRDDSSKDIADVTDALVIDPDKDGHRYITLDMTKVYFTGNENMENLIKEVPEDKSNFRDPEADAATEWYWKNVSITVYREDLTYISISDGKVQTGSDYVVQNHDNYTYKIDLTKSGKYQVKLSMRNTFKPSDASVTKSTSFSLDAESSKKNTNLNKVWGIILIVLSVGLLAGVIFYFVKTARATRFVDAPRTPKKDKKEIAKPADAPKNEEAPKNDAK